MHRYISHYACKSSNISLMVQPWPTNNNNKHAGILSSGANIKTTLSNIEGHCNCLKICDFADIRNANISLDQRFACGSNAGV